MEQTEYTITEIDKSDDKPGIQLLADGRLVLCFADDNKRCNSDCPGFEFVKWHEGGEDRIVLHCLGKREIRLAAGAAETEDEKSFPVKKICGWCDWSLFISGKCNYKCTCPSSPNYNKDVVAAGTCDFWKETWSNFEKGEENA